MNEIVTANCKNYTVKNITTGLNTISFTLSDPVEDAENAFREVKELMVGDEKGTVYGQFPDIEFASITTSANGNVTITMHILSETEKQIKELQASQADQDETIAEMLYGGGGAQ